METKIGSGRVNFFSKLQNGATIFLGYKDVTFYFEYGVPFLKCFCEGIREANTINRKGNNKFAEYEWTGTFAFCDIIQDKIGTYINDYPIMVYNWENYGIEK